MGQWFVDRGWVPALAELDVGHVKDGGELPDWAKDDDDYLKMMTGFYRMSDAEARKSLECVRDRGWIADVAGLVIFVKHRLQAMRLGHLMDLGLPTSYMTWLCEVKVTRSDFLQDDKFKKPPQAHLQLLAVPKGLIKIEEIPRGWGLLEVKGERVYKNMDCLEHHLYELTDEVNHDFMQRMVWAMWWRHYNESIYNFQKKMGQRRSVESDSRKVSRIIEATLEYVTHKKPRIGGEALGDYLQRKGINRKPSAWTMEMAEEARKEFQDGSSEGAAPR